MESPFHNEDFGASFSRVNLSMRELWRYNYKRM